VLDMKEKALAVYDPPVRLSTFADPVPPSASVWEFETVKNWAENWLSRCHPDLGRSGAVCPYSGSAIKKNLFRVAFVRGNDLDHDGMVALLGELAAAFPLLTPGDGPDSMYKAVALVFPDVTDFRQIDAVQEECKSAFVERGLMVGQFYPGHRHPGLRNPDFRPLDAPFPMLAVRHMVATDFPFLCDDERWLAAYLARFTPGDADWPANGRGELRRSRRDATSAPFRP
jgi:hypothetical protein